MVSPRSVLPSLSTSVTAADFTMVSPELWFTGVAVDEGPELIGSDVSSPVGGGGVPWAVAVLLTTPASTSAWVMVWTVVAVQVSAAPGLRLRLGHVVAPAVGSVTPTLVRVTVPVLVTR